MIQDSITRKMTLIKMRFSMLSILSIIYITNKVPHFIIDFVNGSHKAIMDKRTVAMKQ